MEHRDRLGRHFKGRTRLSLNCSVCGSRNYRTNKVRSDGTPPLELKKFCKHCNQHTLHVESK